MRHLVNPFGPTGLSPRGRGNRATPPLTPGRNGSIPARAGEPAPAFLPAVHVGVYPRAGGGTESGLHRTLNAYGLSPRGRGNQHGHRAHGQRHRSIPARAGEPRMSWPGVVQPEVYPRAGGGTSTRRRADGGLPGLSPRGRGNRHVNGLTLVRCRSIPARAGEPPRSIWHHQRCGVYPRAGGGTTAAAVLSFPGVGLSPRGRGNRCHVGRQGTFLGSIPARAGEPGDRGAGGFDCGLYPRAGGGTRLINATLRSDEGLSPRGRGNHATEEHPAGVKRSIPARAGEPDPTEGVCRRV